MYALSLWQPWASFFARGLKTFETRSWRPPFAIPRGGFWLAVHAGKRWSPEVGRLCLTEPFRTFQAKCGYDGDPLLGNPYPVGCLVGCVRIHTVVPTSELVARSHFLNKLLTLDELAVGDFGARRFAWHADMVFPCKEPIAYRGSQGLFKLRFSEGRLEEIRTKGLWPLPDGVARLLAPGHPTEV